MIITIIAIGLFLLLAVIAYLFWQMRRGRKWTEKNKMGGSDGT